MSYKVLQPLSSIIGLAGLAVSVGLARAFDTRPLAAENHENSNKKFRVAVIGAGIGGSSTSYFIREYLGSDVHIDVFEKSGKVGGRTALVGIDDNFFEAGASIIHDSNKYMLEFCKMSGLERLKDGSVSSMGIYSGSEFVYQSSGYPILDKLKLFWRYGYGLIKMNSFTSEIIGKFINIYKLQEEGKCFETVPEFLKALGGDDFVELTEKSAREAMLEKGVSKRIIDELATAVTRCNYGQDMGVNAFTGSVSLAGAQSSKLWAVKGGNYQLSKVALEKSKATLNLNTRVMEIDKKVSKTDGIKYAIRSKKIDSGFIYDAVVVAIPLEAATTQLQFRECSKWPKRDELGKYQRTLATFVKGKLNYTSFGFEKASDLPAAILTTENPQLSFNSIGLQKSIEGKSVELDGGHRVYKVFSRKPLTEEQLDNIFESRLEIKVVDWLAYPHYQPPEKFSPFKLDDGVFYVNAIERVASAIEMGAVGGKNAALLTVKYLKAHKESTGRKQKENAKGEL